MYTVMTRHPLFKTLYSGLTFYHPQLKMGYPAVIIVNLKFITLYRDFIMERQ
jgi:hypothetical protein